MLVAQFSISLIQWIQRSHHSLRSFVLPFTAYQGKLIGFLNEAIILTLLVSSLFIASEWVSPSSQREYLKDESGEMLELLEFLF